MLFYVEYGCDCERVEQVVEANSLESAEEWAQAAAFDSYWSFDIQSDPEEFESYEEWIEACEEDCVEYTFWRVEPYDPSSERHVDTKEESEVYKID